MIPPHLSQQIHIFLFQQNDCTPPKCGDMSEYTDIVHTEVEDPSSRYMTWQQSLVFSLPPIPV